MAFKLPRIPRGLRIVEKDGTAAESFRVWMDRYATDIETEVGALAAAQAAEAAAATAQTAAATAQTAADAAQSSADDAATVAKLTGSGVVGCTIAASDAGADATITISAHTRIYGDGATLAAGGGSVTGLAYSTTYFVYYDDATFADTTPAYLATTSETTAAQVGVRHLVGQATTPAALGADIPGFKVDPSGIGYINP